MFSGIMKPMCVMNQWHKFLYLSDFILIGCYLSYPMLFYLFPALSVCSQSSHKISSFKVILKILIFLRVRHLMSYSWFIIRITLLLKKNIYIFLFIQVRVAEPWWQAILKSQWLTTRETYVLLMLLVSRGCVGLFSQSQRIIG